MVKRMFAVTVKTLAAGPEGPEIIIEGPEYRDANNEETRDMITVSPDQIDTLIEWLKQAKEELSGK